MLDATPTPFQQVRLLMAAAVLGAVLSCVQQSGVRKARR
jgi:hypothetical protein